MTPRPEDAPAVIAATPAAACSPPGDQATSRPTTTDAKWGQFRPSRWGHCKSSFSPSDDDGVQPSRQIVEGQICAPMDPHPEELGALGLQRLGAHRGQEAGEVPTSRRPRLPCSEGEPEKGEAGVLMLSPTLAVLAIDDPCLVGMES